MLPPVSTNGADVAELMERGLKLKPTAHEAGSEPARNVVLLKYQDVGALDGQLCRSTQAAVSSADYHTVVGSLDLLRCLSYNHLPLPSKTTLQSLSHVTSINTSACASLRAEERSKAYENRPANRMMVRQGDQAFDVYAELQPQEPLSSTAGAAGAGSGSAMK